MNTPKILSSRIQKRLSVSALKDYINKIKWRKIGDSGIDLECGDGSFSVLLKNFAPYRYNLFVACDINEEMIHFAKNRYAREDISFVVMDIAGEIPEHMIGAFNHVFSFYALHWVKDQEKAFRNIHTLMSKDGDCFLTYLATSAVYSACAALAHYPKWKLLLKDVNLFVSLYYEVQDPEKKVAEIMAKCGFMNIDTTSKTVTNIYDSVQSLKDLVQSVEPFTLPDELVDDFIKDYIAVSVKLGVLRVERDVYEGKYFASSDVVVVAFAKK